MVVLPVTCILAIRVSPIVRTGAKLTKFCCYVLRSINHQTDVSTPFSETSLSYNSQNIHS